MTTTAQPTASDGAQIVEDLEAIDRRVALIVWTRLVEIADRIRAEIDVTIMPNPRADQVARLAATLVDPRTRVTRTALEVTESEARLLDGNR